LLAGIRSEELPIRIARRVRELKKLPHGLGEMPSIIQVPLTRWMNANKK
jgi:hypothetical protein